MNLRKKIAATATMAGALSFGALFGAGAAQADNWWDVPDPVPPPGVINEIPFVPPPGQIAHLPLVPPPGHWDKPGKWLPWP